MKKSVFFLGALAFGSLAFSSCSKSDDGGNNNPGTGNQKTYKFTIKASGIDNPGAGGDRFSITFSGADLNATKTIWKVNGVTRSNETVFSLDEDDFGTGATFVIESLVPLVAVSGSISASNFEGGPIDLTLTPVVNGNAEAVISQSVTKDFTKILSY
jgi:hypothetical protein